MKMAREYVLRENKPIIFEAMAYRYVKHHHILVAIDTNIVNFPH